MHFFFLRSLSLVLFKISFIILFGLKRFMGFPPQKLRGSLLFARLLLTRCRTLYSQRNRSRDRKMLTRGTESKTSVTPYNHWRGRPAGTLILFILIFFYILQQVCSERGSVLFDSHGTCQPLWHVAAVEKGFCLLVRPVSKSPETFLTGRC